MSSKVKKILILAVIAVLVVAILAAALLIGGGKTGKDSGGDNTGNNTGDGTSSTEKNDPLDKLPDETYDGAQFRICNRGTYTSMEVFCYDEKSTELRDVALMKRNSAVEDLFEVEIYPISYGESDGEQMTKVLADLLTEDPGYEIAMTYVYESAPLAVNGYLLNWNKLEYTDLSQSYWMNNVNSNFQIKDAIYTAVGKMCISTITNTYAMFYNRTLGDSLDPDMTNELFDTIRNGDWTYDYFYNLVSNIYQNDDDLNEVSAGDIYGYRCVTDFSVDTWQSAWELPAIKNDVETGLTDVYMSEKRADAANRLYELYFETTGTYVDANWNDARNYFKSGKGLFLNMWLNAAFNQFVGMDDIYTILPYPKYDDNQTEYVNGAADNYSVMVVPAATKDPSYVSAIVEALNIYSEEYLYPAYRYQALQGKYVSDPDTVEMLNYVLDTVTFDIATLLHKELKMIGIMRLMLIDGSSSVADYYDAKQDEIASALAEIMLRFDMFKD